MPDKIQIPNLGRVCVYRQRDGERFMAWMCDENPTRNPFSPMGLMVAKRGQGMVWVAEAPYLHAPRPEGEEAPEWGWEWPIFIPPITSEEAKSAHDQSESE